MSPIGVSLTCLANTLNMVKAAIILSKSELEIYKIANDIPEERYANVDTGNIIQEHTAKLKGRYAHTDHYLRIVGNDYALFRKIQVALGNTVREYVKKREDAAARIYKLAKAQIPKRVRDEVWDEYTGDKPRCYCCRADIAKDNWACAHVVSVRRGGNDDAYNLRPTCLDCARKKGERSIFRYIEEETLPGPARC